MPICLVVDCTCHVPAANAITDYEPGLKNIVFENQLKANFPASDTHKSHSHCWEQRQPPACGLKGKHIRCCLCEATVSDKKEWEKEARTFEFAHKLGCIDGRRQALEEVVTLVETKQIPMPDHECGSLGYCSHYTVADVINTEMKQLKTSLLTLLDQEKKIKK